MNPSQNLRAPLSRREFLARTGMGLGLLSLGATAHAESAAGSTSPLAVRTPHFAPRAKRVKGETAVRASYRDAVVEPGVAPMLALQFVTVFALALGISLLPTFLADVRGISPALVAILGGVGSTGAALYGLVIARSRRLQRYPLFAIIVAVVMVMGTMIVVLATPMIWLIALAFVGRGGLWSAWGLYAATLSEVVRTDRVRSRVFALSEMMGGSAFSTAPIVSGQLYAVRPEGPLVASLVASAALIPVLYIAQRRIGSGRPLTEDEEAIALAAPLADPEAA